jgi:hypothetical protein
MSMAEAIKKANSTKAENGIKGWGGLTFEPPVGRMPMSQVKVAASKTLTRTLKKDVPRVMGGFSS